jgi:hypothetical protein
VVASHDDVTGEPARTVTAGPVLANTGAAGYRSTVSPSSPGRLASSAMSWFPAGVCVIRCEVV